MVELLRHAIIAAAKDTIKQRILLNLPLFAGGFFVLVILVILVAKLEYVFLSPKIPDSPPISLVIGKDTKTRNIIFDRFKYLPNSNLELIDIFSLFPKEIVLTALNQPIESGIIIHADHKQLTALAFKRQNKNAYVRPLGNGFITISSSPSFYERIYNENETVPFWNLIEIKSLLGRYNGVIRESSSPSEVGTISTNNLQISIDLSRMLYTNLNLARALPNILNSKMITIISSKMPDGSVLKELRINKINLNLDNSENNDIDFNPEGVGNKICFQASSDICF